MPGLVPGIRVFGIFSKQDVDGRDKPGHDRVASVLFHPHMRCQQKAPHMSPPLTVNIPHRLGKDEARRRIEGGLGRAKGEFARLLTLEEEVWSGDTLSFRVAALGQRASGTIDVHEDHVRLVVTLPWLLARFAHGVQRVVGKRGEQLLLDPPSSSPGRRGAP